MPWPGTVNAFDALDGDAALEFNSRRIRIINHKHLFLLIFLFVFASELQQSGQHIRAVLVRWQDIPEFRVGHQLLHRPR
jgi:hypothetical protein